MHISRRGELSLACFTCQIVAEQFFKMKRTVFRETYSTRGYDFRVLKLLIGLVAFFLLGCNAVSKKGATSDSPASQEHRTVVVPALVRTEGKVVRTNLKLNFVVLDFGFKRLPQVGQQLGIFRLGKKIGQVRVSGPAWETYTVADIVDGDEIWIGDQARLK